MVLKRTPSNCRGITLFSSLQKLFSSLVYNRIENEIENKDMLSLKAKVGFRKNYRTTYHIFALFSLIEKTISNGKYLCTCFGVFWKVYDSICRIRLLHRLKETELIGKILDIIK